MVGFGATWSEFASPERLRASLPMLADHQIALHLAWPVDDPARPRRLELAAEAEALGVVLRPWLLLPRDQGYWAGVANAASFAAAARGLMRDWQAAGLTPTGFIVDMEPPYHTLLALERALRQRRWRAMLSWLGPGFDGRAHSLATHLYQDLVTDAHACGWRVLMTTLPFVVDDPGAERLLGLVVDGVDWDRVSLQVYRTMFVDYAQATVGRGLFGPGLVRSYALAAIQRFGGRAAMDLGLVAEGVYPALAYERPEQLHQDVAAALSSGITPEHVHVYSLDGMLDRSPGEAWLRAAGSGSVPGRDLATWPMRRAIGAGLRLWRWSGRGALTVAENGRQE